MGLLFTSELLSKIIRFCIFFTKNMQFPVLKAKNIWFAIKLRFDELGYNKFYSDPRKYYLFTYTKIFMINNFTKIFNLIMVFSVWVNRKNGYSKLFVDLKRNFRSSFISWIIYLFYGVFSEAKEFNKSLSLPVEPWVRLLAYSLRLLISVPIYCLAACFSFLSCSYPASA